MGVPLIHVRGHDAPLGLRECTSAGRAVHRHPVRAAVVAGVQQCCSQDRGLHSFVTACAGGEPKCRDQTMGRCERKTYFLKVRLRQDPYRKAMQVRDRARQGNNRAR